MPRGTEQLTYIECDNKSCKKRHYTSGDEVAPGFYGTVTRADGGGEEQATFYSCSPAPGHIGKAILGALAAPVGSPPEGDTLHDQG